MSTVKADSLQPTIAGNNLILKTGSGDVERVRIAPTGDMTVSSTVASTFGGSVTVNGVSTLKGKLGLGAAYFGTPAPDLDIVTSNNSSLLDPQLNTFTTTQNRAAAAFGNASSITKMFVGNSSTSNVWLQAQGSDNAQKVIALNPVGGGVFIGATATSGDYTSLRVYDNPTLASAEIRITHRPVSGADFGIFANTSATKMFRIVDRSHAGGTNYCDRLWIDSDGNIGMGTTSGMGPIPYLNYSGSNPFACVLSLIGRSDSLAAADGRIEFVNPIAAASVDATTTFGRILFTNGGQSGTNALKAQIHTVSSAAGANKGGNLLFSTNPGGSTSTSIATRMTITEIGLVGIANDAPTYTLDVTGTGRFTNSTNSNKLLIQGYGNLLGYGIRFDAANDTSAVPCRFHNAAGTLVGAINTTASATTYVTSSDYRLKDNPVQLTGALSRVEMLKPSSYTWKVDGTAGEGFLAHELAEVVPLAVVGEKDAVDENGEAILQQVDLSKIVPVLTAAIKELKAIVDAQAVEIAQLKAK